MDGPSQSCRAKIRTPIISGNNKGVAKSEIDGCPEIALKLLVNLVFGCAVTNSCVTLQVLR